MSRKHQPSQKPNINDVWRPKAINRTTGPKHKMVGQSDLKDRDVFFHTLGRPLVWSLPLKTLIWSQQGRRVLRGMSPEDALRVGFYAGQLHAQGGRHA